MSDKGCVSNTVVEPRVEVLLANPHEADHASFREILRHSSWKLHEAFNRREALAIMHERQVSVVICEQNLPDGDWKTVLQELEAMPNRPRLIVSSRLADPQLWGEVLNLGGYDVLQTPFDAEEVFRVSFLAWHSSRNEAQRLAATRKAAGREETATPRASRAAGAGRSDG